MSDRVIEIKNVRRVSDHPRQVMMDFSPSRTKQAPAEACDVNSIMARYARTGVLPVQRMQAVYADVSGLAGFDYAATKAMMDDVNEKFMQLPANVRDYMKNDPAVFMEFVSNPANMEKAVELGLVEAPKVEVKPNE